MYIDFDQLQNDARIWIYQSDRALTDQECQQSFEALKEFIDNWNAHGSELKASVQLAYNRFIVIGLEEAHHLPSGCSIDASVGVIRNLEAALGNSFFDRLNLLVKTSDSVESKSLKEVKSLIKSETLPPDTLVFDNTITTKLEMQQQWPKEVGNTWLGRYYSQKV